MNKKGFTLLEVLMAVTLLFVGIIAVLQLFIASQMQARLAADRTIAPFVAQSNLALIQAAGPQALPKWLQSNAIRSLEQIAESGDIVNGWHSSAQMINQNPETYRITFVVELRDGQQRSFVTYITEKGHTIQSFEMP